MEPAHLLTANTAVKNSGSNPGNFRKSDIDTAASCHSVNNSKTLEPWTKETANEPPFGNLHALHPLITAHIVSHLCRDALSNEPTVSFRALITRGAPCGGLSSLLDPRGRPLVFRQHGRYTAGYTRKSTSVTCHWLRCSKHGHINGRLLNMTI